MHILAMLSAISATISCAFSCSFPFAILFLLLKYSFFKNSFQSWCRSRNGHSQQDRSLLKYLSCQIFEKEHLQRFFRQQKCAAFGITDSPVKELRLFIRLCGCQNLSIPLLPFLFPKKRRVRPRSLFLCNHPKYIACS